MEELDLLKKDWKRNESTFHQISESTISEMLHKKSSSIVKWILIISILEVSVWTALSIFFDSDAAMKKVYSDEILWYIKIFNILNYVVIAVFIGLFYRNYKSISTLKSTKQLMTDILKTRKTVQYYVWYNLGMIAFSMIVVFILAFNLNPQVHKLIKTPGVLAVSILICLVAVVAFVVVFWLFYRLLYGILLRKLNRNYDELRKVDL
ncbi:MAG: hypothetical protein H7239_11850 [Flavobacterium sp.]|nr:hypothetical protein [Flavobacterium sp.]